ncbi:MAG: hypothetical protein KBD64_05415 [Gammaproteobacteria bacterium]|nr:hypothetical protein [Gammaproteobacteria bacterium]
MLKKGFTIIECLFVISITLCLSLVFTQAMFFISTLKKDADLYSNYLANSQYLYWLFSNSRINGILNFQDNYLKNTNQIDWIKQLDKFYNSPNIELLSAKEFISKKKLSSYFAKKIMLDSTVVNIKYLWLDKTVKLQILERYYYIGKTQRAAQNNSSNTDNTDETYSLYQYFNNYSDELIPDITKMQVEKLNLNEKNYYYFKFEFAIPDQYFKNQYLKNLKLINNKIDFIIN